MQGKGSKNITCRTPFPHYITIADCQQNSHIYSHCISTKRGEGSGIKIFWSIELNDPLIWWFVEQDPVQTMQYTGLTNFSSILVCSVLEKGTYHLRMWSLRGSQQPFSFVLGHFSMVTPEQTNKQSTRWSQSKPALDQWEGSLLHCIP